MEELTVNIKQASAFKDQLEKEITTLLNNFHDDTGLRVSNILIKSVMPAGGYDIIIVEVKIP